MLEKAIGKRVAELRGRAGLTQQRLADLVGVSVETISRLERGVTIPSVVKLCEIADKMGFRLKDMFVFEAEPSEKDRLLDEVTGMLISRSVEEMAATKDILETLLAGFDTVRRGT